MNTLKALTLAFLALAFASTGFAQTSTTKTALSTALTDVQTRTVIVASATGITASTAGSPQFIYIDQEQMRVTAISSTTLTVARGTAGLATNHLAGSVIWFGNPGNYNSSTGDTATGVFITKDPVGRCTRANNAFLPVINPSTGVITDCILSTTATTANWARLNTFPITNVVPYKKTAVSATAYTLLPNDEVVGINTNSAFTITTCSCSMPAGKRYTLQHEVTGNQTLTIATSGSETINGATSITVGGSTNFGGVDIYYDGGGKYFATRAH